MFDLLLTEIQNFMSRLSRHLALSSALELVITFTYTISEGLNLH